jgi:hypothetical protein
MNLKYPLTKPRLALLGASGIIAGAAILGTTVISQAATPTAQVAPATPDAPGAEAPAAAEKPEANEPALPGGGHNDTAANADYQFDGVQ